jgi:hypothetical protein
LSIRQLQSDGGGGLQIPASVLHARSHQMIVGTQEHSGVASYDPRAGAQAPEIGPIIVRGRLVVDRRGAGRCGGSVASWVLAALVAVASLGEIGRNHAVARLLLRRHRTGPRSTNGGTPMMRISRTVAGAIKP